MIKLQNTRHNRKLLREAGYPFYDPHHTFNRKAWIIVGEDGKTLHGVGHRDYVTVTVCEFLTGETQ